MTHLDPESLALVALGEQPLTPEERRHLEDCAGCTAELRGFARAVAATRGAGEPLAVPHERVWEGIARVLGIRIRTDGTSIARPRRRRLVVGVAAAAVVLLGALALGAWGLSQQSRQLASATLRALPDWPGRSGTAVLERLADGREVLRVRTTVRPDGSTDHEVWLMTDGARRLVSLGLLRGEDGTFVVPADVDLRLFHLVDVSDEPRDGNPAHSGNSIVRGAFRS